MGFLLYFVHNIGFDEDLIESQILLHNYTNPSWGREKQQEKQDKVLFASSIDVVVTEECFH